MLCNLLIFENIPLYIVQATIKNKNLYKGGITFSE